MKRDACASRPEVPVDLIPYRESVIRDRVDIVGSLPWIAANEGTVVYERSDAA